MAEIPITLNEADVRRIAAAVVEQLAEVQGGPAASAPPVRILWRETDAAAALGVSWQWLKEMRLRGYIRASTTQKPILYSRADLEAAAEFLVKNAASA